MTDHRCYQADQCVLDPHCPHFTSCCRTSDPDDPVDSIRLKDVARLDLQPSDIVVITVPANTSLSDADTIRRRIVDILGGRLTIDRLLILPETMTLRTVRQHDGEHR